MLVETLGVEYIRELWRIADFGLTLADEEWDEVRENRGACWRMARERGCRR